MSVKKYIYGLIKNGFVYSGGHSVCVDFKLVLITEFKST